MGAVRKTEFVVASSIAIAGALLIFLSTSAGVFAQKSDPVDEIIRKSEANDLEAGFCATTGWPNGDDLGQFTAYLNKAVEGTSKVSTFATGGCSFDRVTRVHLEKRGKCVSYKTWTCTFGDTCGVIPLTVDCLNAKGVFVERREN